MTESNHCRQRYEYCKGRMDKLEEYLIREICLKIAAEVKPLNIVIKDMQRAVEVKADKDKVSYGQRLSIISLIVSSVGFLSMMTFIFYRVYFDK